MEDSGSSYLEKTLSFLRSNILIAGLFFTGLILLGVGLIQIVGTKTAAVKFEKGASVQNSESNSDQIKIKVDVEGQVQKPGVYVLSLDARVQDALIAAGGLSSSADRRQINLAAKISDGQKIYIPAAGEVIPASVSTVSTVLGGTSATGQVSVNSGSESELDMLPSIGSVTAQKIINGRPYSSIEELVTKKVIGQKTFDKIKDKISI